MEMTGRDERSDSRPAILHIGVHKTGSTSIQRHLSARAERLEAKGIALYPRAARLGVGPGNFGHHLIPMLFTGQIDDFTLFERMRDEIAASVAKKIILSSEIFSLLDDSAIAALIDALGMPVKVVFFYRRQSDYIQAIYATTVLTSHETRDFADFADNFDAPLDYHVLAKRWAAVCGSDNVVPIAYRSPGSDEGDSVTAFLSAIGLKRPKQLDERRANRRPPARVIHELLHMRKQGASQEQINAAFHAATRRPDWRDGSPIDFMTASEAQAFDLRFVDSNAAFHAAFCRDQPPITPRRA